MKRPIISILLFLNGFVNADRMVRFILNNGLPPIPFKNECSAADDELINPLFNISAYARRRLRSVSSSDRKLVTYPPKCKDNCAGLVPGTCRATNCVGFRRNRELLDVNQTCATNIEAIHLALDGLIAMNNVSEPCKVFLSKSMRKAECYDDIVYGEITSFTFWNMNGGKARKPGPNVYNVAMKTDVKNGYNVCSSIPLNLEAVLNPCVKFTTWNMTGPNNSFYTRTDSGHPMGLFSSLENVATFGGKYLSPGTYNVTATPDGFDYKTKSLTFNVVRC